MLAEPELAALASDIKANGLRVPILTHEGKILDGRNRFKACEEAGVEPRFEPFAGDDPLAAVISLNLKRRHLTPSQAAAVAVDVLPELERRAKERMKAGGQRGGKGKEKVPDPIPSAGQARDEAAEMFGINPRYVSDAKKIKEEAPEEFEAVRSGKMTVSAAMRKVRMKEPPPERVETPGFPDGPFRTLVIDPPWPMQKVVLERRAAEKTKMDYATWTLDEIGKLPVGRLADSRGAHVYLWVTHKFLPEGLRLFGEWGVRYECLLTWVKPTAQPLWWRFLTEHCLFGKVGSLPLRKKGMSVSFDAPQQKHSHKPEEFYELVRTVSPGPRLTLFDYDRDGFQRWGITH